MRVPVFVVIALGVILAAGYLAATFAVACLIGACIRWGMQ